MKGIAHIEYLTTLYAITRKLFVTVFLFVLIGNPLKSQDLDVGITAGGCYYLGDLNPAKHFMYTQVAYGVLVRYNLDTRWSVKLSGLRGNIKGNSSSSSFLPENELSFTSKLTDIAAVVEFNFMPFFTGSHMNAISPYIYTGLSAFFFDPVQNGVSLRPLGTEGQNIGYDGRAPYGSVSVSIPFGLGVKVSLAKRLGMQAFWEIHKGFNDYLDDVSTTYYLAGHSISPGDEAGVISDPTLNHEPGMQRGNSSTKDWFAFFGLSVTYKFKLLGSKKCRDLNH